MHTVSGHSQLDLFGSTRPNRSKKLQEPQPSDHRSEWNYLFASVCLAITAVSLLLLLVLAARGIFV